MATRNWVTVVRTSTYVISTVTLGNGDVSDLLDLTGYPDKTAHIFGTFGSGGTIHLRGRNSSTAGNPQALHRADSPTSTFSSVTAELLALILENPLYLYADVSAGDGTTSLNVVVVASV